MSENNLNQKNLIDDDEPLVKLSKGRLIFSMLVLYLLFNFDLVVRLGINSLFPLIQADLNLSDTQVGTIASVVLIGMSVFVLPISFLAEKFSKKKAIIGMGLLWSVGSLITGFVKSFPLILLSRFSVGVGNSAYAPVSTSVITTWFRKSQWGKVLGIYNTALTLGVAGGTALAGVLAVKFGWRGAIIGLSAISVIISLLSFFIPKDEEKVKGEKDDKVSIKNAFIAIIKNKTLLTMSVFYGLATMIQYAVLAWIPIYCIRIMGMTVPQAAGILGLVSLAGIIGSLDRLH